MTPDRCVRFSHDGHAEVFETLLETMRRGKGGVVLTGGPGTGKTTLIDGLAANLERDGYFVREVSNSQVDLDYLTKLVGFAFSRKMDALKEIRLLAKTKKQLIGKNSAGQ